MEQNQVEAKIASLSVGETLLVSVKQVANGKVHLQFAEKIVNPTVPASGAGALLSELNASDERFSSGARRTWVTAQPSDACKVFPAAAEEIMAAANGEEGTEVFIGILNPVNAAGQRVRVQVQETTEPTEYQAQHVMETAKTRGDGGELITYKGSPIWSNTSATIGEPQNIFLQADAPVAKPEVQIAEDVSTEDQVATA